MCLCVCVNQCKGCKAVGREGCCRQSTLLTQSLTAPATATAHSRRSTSPDPVTHVCMCVHTHTDRHIHTRTPLPPARCDAKTKQYIKKCKSKTLGAVASTSTAGTFRGHSARPTSQQAAPANVEHPEPLIKLIILLSFL